MLKNNLFGIFAFIAGVMLVFALLGCDQGPEGSSSSTPQSTWEPVNIAPITGTRAGNAISFEYEGSPCTLTKSGESDGGDSLDGVWKGTFEGDTVRVTVSGSNWTMAVLDSGSYVDYAKGTLSASGVNLTIIVTHVMVYDDPNVGNANNGPDTINDPVLNGTWKDQNTDGAKITVTFSPGNDYSAITWGGALGTVLNTVKQAEQNAGKTFSWSVSRSKNLDGVFLDHGSIYYLSYVQQTTPEPGGGFGVVTPAAVFQYTINQDDEIELSLDQNLLHSPPPNGNVQLYNQLRALWPEQPDENEQEIYPWSYPPIVLVKNSSGGGPGGQAYNPTGTWDFTISGQNATVTITGNNWVFDGSPGTSDTGTFTLSGNTGTLYSNAWNTNIGTATITSNTTMTLTLHSPSLITGTFYGTKRSGDGPGGEEPSGSSGIEVDTVGLLTITGLGAYNGQEVRAYCGNNNVSQLTLEAVGTLLDTGEAQLRYKYIPSNITGDETTLKVYKQDGQSPNHTFSSYSGNNQNVSFTVWIKNTDLDTSKYGSATVNFTNGIGSGVFVPNP
jgi:hypothetical protein